ncbi:MAG: flagellar hook-basal body complex protein, partial [Planctomycetota bacterium]|nr:flagellar hook-basal body complex protein [Planctomycetota bacterium]
MALLRALNSAISGLQSHQFRIDVIGDNLANANTTGFKVGRANFQNMLSQTLSFGSAPQGFLGGIDPKQLGLGVLVGDTSKDFRQGGLNATGITGDLAVEGDGFFILNDVSGQPVYSRDGAFSINPANLMHNPTNGYIVQGWQADFTTFQLAPGGPVTNLEIPIGDLVIARATNVAEFDGNLNADGDLANSGTVVESEVFVDVTIPGPGNQAALNTLLTNLGRRGAGGGPDVDFLLATGDIIEITATKGNRELPTMRFQVDTLPPQPGIDATGTTLTELMTFVRQVLGINNGGDDTYSGLITSGSFQAGEALTATQYQAAITVNFGTLGVEAGDFIRFTTGAGAGQIAQIASIASAGGGTNNVLNFVLPLDATVPLPVVGNLWEINEQARVALGTGGAVPGTPAVQDRQSALGVVRVSGNAGLFNELKNIEISENGNRLTTFTEIEEAAGESIVSNATFYDSLGAAHTIEITYVFQSRSDTGTVWRWFGEAVDNYGPNRVVGTGYVNFGTDGQYFSENPQAAISIDLANSGAQTPLIVSVDHAKLTAFASQLSEVALVDQDGYGMGTLVDYAVGTDGVITGIFDNGLTRTIGQIAMARFANNNGLEVLGGNMFRVGTNSGLPLVGTPGSFARGNVRSGFLEESNIDIARQFTDLIVTQRAFQANTRTVT